MQMEELIKKFYLGKLSQEETAFLLNYLKDEEPQHEVLDFYQNLWDKPAGLNNNVDSGKIYKQIVRSIGISEEEGNQKKIFLSQYLKEVLRYAAVFILAFGLSWLFHSYFRNETKTQSVSMVEQSQIIEVPYGSKSRVVLPDGSVVTLNSGSILKYSNSDFCSDNRSVYLTGEGFFSVTKNPIKPFYVKTPGIKVKVLGTTFNVKAYADEDIEEATLVSGKVEIYHSSDKTEMEKPIVLKPNQRAVFLKSKKEFFTNDSAMICPVITPVQLKKVSLQSSSKTEQTILWKENTLVFDNEPFNSLVIKIERWYAVKILVNYKELNSARFSGKFDKETVEQVLNALKTVTPFNYNIKQNLITISEK